MKKILLYILTSTFILASCGGGGGGGGGSAPVAPSNPTPVVNFSASSSSVLIGVAVTLTWSSSNAVSCSASWTNKTSTSGTEIVTISYIGDTIFNISCTGAGGAIEASIIIVGYLNEECMPDGNGVSDYTQLKEKIESSGGDGKDNIIYLKNGEYRFAKTNSSDPPLSYVGGPIIYDAKGTNEKLSIIGCDTHIPNIILNGSSRKFEFYRNGPTIPDDGSAEYEYKDTLPPFPSIEISNLTISDSYPNSDFDNNCVRGPCGSAINAERFNLELNNTRFVDNRGVQSFLEPNINYPNIISGVVHLKIHDSLFENNATICNLENNADVCGRLITFHGDLDIFNTNFRNNENLIVLDPKNRRNLKVNLSCYKRKITDSFFQENVVAFMNKSHIYHGCLYNDHRTSPQLEIINSEFKNHKFAISMSGNLNITNSKFIDNYEGVGGFDASNNPCDSLKNGSYYSYASGSCKSGGAINLNKIFSDDFDSYWGVLTIKDSEFTGNSATDFGGAINMGGSVRCDDSFWEYYRSGCNEYSYGNIVSNISAEPFDIIIKNSTFKNNSSHRGAAISLGKVYPQAGNILIENSIFESNIATIPEGYEQNVEDKESSIVVVGGDAEIYNTTFLDNVADIEIWIKGTLSCDNSCN